MHWMDTPTKAIVTVDLKKVRDNASRAVSRLPGSAVVARTKTTRGSPEVGAATLSDTAPDRLPSSALVAHLCAGLVHAIQSCMDNTQPERRTAPGSAVADRPLGM